MQQGIFAASAVRVRQKSGSRLLLYCAASIVERWQSGRMRRIRNPVYGYTVPWVRIPPSPPPIK
jgi:hypothetical protein